MILLFAAAFLGLIAGMVLEASLTGSSRDDAYRLGFFKGAEAAAAEHERAREREAA